MNTQDTKTMTQEEQEALNLRFSLAALLGTTLYKYGRESLHITFDGFEEMETEADERDRVWRAALGETEVKPVFSAGTAVDEQESPGQQTIQALTLLHPDVRRLFGTSAIYQILADIASRFDREGETMEEQLDGMNLVTLSGVWIITRRIFALGHAGDCSKMIDCLIDAVKGKAQEPQQLEAATETDFENAAYFYSVYFPESEKPNDPTETDRLHQLPSEAIRPEPQTSIDTFIATDSLYAPSSKPFRKQKEIAAAGKLKINVGRENHPVTVIASITDKEGKPLTLTEFEMNIEAAIGQMFQMNNYRSFTCTPAQIYRVYAGMEPNDNVSPAQVEKTIRAMDKLLTTPATLNFAEQLEQHTRLKKRENFDYTDAQRVGTLITGVHDQKRKHSYNGIEITDTFTIHEMPMFYAYSYAVGQIYTVSKYLLTGATPPDPEAQKKATKKKATTKRLSSDDIDLRRYLLRHIEYQKQIKAKQELKYRRQLKPLPKTFEFFLTFDTIASEIGYEADSPKKIRMLREQTYDYMQELVKAKALQKADYYKKGKALHGIHVWL